MQCTTHPALKKYEKLLASYAEAILEKHENSSVTTTLKFENPDFARDTTRQNDLYMEEEPEPEQYLNILGADDKADNSYLTLEREKTLKRKDPLQETQSSTGKAKLTTRGTTAEGRENIKPANKPVPVINERAEKFEDLLKKFGGKTTTKIR